MKSGTRLHKTAQDSPQQGMAFSTRTVFSILCVMLLVPTLHFSPLPRFRDHQQERGQAPRLSDAGLVSDTGPVSHTQFLAHTGLVSDTEPVSHIQFLAHTGPLSHGGPLSHDGQSFHAARGLSHDRKESHEAKASRAREVSDAGELSDSVGLGRTGGLQPSGGPLKTGGELSRAGEQPHAGELPRPHTGGLSKSGGPDHAGPLSHASGHSQPASVSFAGALSGVLLRNHLERNAITPRHPVFPKAVSEIRTRWSSSEPDVSQADSFANAVKDATTSLPVESQAISMTTPLNNSYLLDDTDAQAGRHWGNTVVHRSKRSYTEYRYDAIGRNDAGLVDSDADTGQYDLKRLKDKLLLLYQESLLDGHTNQNNAENSLDAFPQRSDITGIHENADDFFAENRNKGLGTRSQPISLDDFDAKPLYRHDHNVNGMRNKLSRPINTSTKSERNDETILLDKLIEEILNQLDKLDFVLNSEQVSMHQDGAWHQVSPETEATALYLYDPLADDRSKRNQDNEAEVRLPEVAPQQTFSRPRFLPTRQKQATPIVVHTRGGKRFFFFATIVVFFFLFFF